MARVNYPDKNTGDQAFASEDNELKGAINDLYLVNEAFNPVLTFNKNKKIGSYDLSTGNLSLTLNITGQIQGTSIIFDLVADGVGTLSLSGDFVVVGTAFTPGTAPAAGNYLVRCNYDGVMVYTELLQVGASPASPPTFVSLVAAADNTYFDVTFSEGVYGAPNGSTPLQFADFNIVFAANGGTATGWTASSIKKNDGATEGGASNLTGGETVVRIFGSLTGSADGQETLTVSPIDGNAIFNVAGVPMDAGQTVNTNFNVSAEDPGLTVLKDGTKTFFYYDINNSTVLNGNPLNTVNDETSNNNDADVGPPPTGSSAAVVENRTIGPGSVKTARCDNGRSLRLPAGLTESIVSEPNGFRVFVTLELDEGQVTTAPLCAWFGLLGDASNSIFIWQVTGASSPSIGFQLENPTDGIVNGYTENSTPPFPSGAVGQQLVEFVANYGTDSTKVPADRMSTLVNGVLQTYEAAQNGDLSGWNPANFTGTKRALIGDANNNDTGTFNSVTPGLNIVRIAICKEDQLTAQNIADVRNYIVIS